ncbi:hypothetical protein G9A89_004917 [Geosiphon pyriformis]|nr:hypothetical protein G9A89_004917 [Geosiphon pyriformis]
MSNDVRCEDEEETLLKPTLTLNGPVVHLIGELRQELIAKIYPVKPIIKDILSNGAIIMTVSSIFSLMTKTVNAQCVVNMSNLKISTFTTLNTKSLVVKRQT